jgi:polar amino acid transport system substrate-binding protein
MKRFVKGLMVFVLAFSLVACSSNTDMQDNSLQDVLDKGEIVIGFTDYPPMGFMVDGEATGFDLEIAKEVADRLGVKAVFQYIDWDAKVLELNSKAIDVIWNGLTITEERKQEILFSKPYFDNRIVILTLQSSTVDAIADLSGLKVGVELQSSGQSALEDSEVFNSLDELVKFTSISEALMALNSNTIDAIVADEIFARYAVSKDSENYRVATEVFGSENYGIGFRLSDVALRDKVDEIIDEIAEEGLGATISLEWFGEDLLKR